MCCPHCAPKMFKFGKGSDGAALDAYAELFTKILMKILPAQLTPKGGDGASLPAFGELVIKKYPEYGVIEVYNSRTGEYERYKDYGNTEVISGSAKMLGDYFKQLIGGRRGFLDVNVNGPGYPFTSPPP